MKRSATQLLQHWLTKANRKPLILRGARQVGKTWLVRRFAEAANRDLIEINFERQPTLTRYFASNDPHDIIKQLSLVTGRSVDPGSALLFLDEIQAAPEILGKLRWFAEEMPQLPVVATGSLLDFALGDAAVSMPVGRVEYLYLEPMGFPEYLAAHSQHALLQMLTEWIPGTALPVAVHDQATKWFDRYYMVGGMPAAVLADVEHQNARECRRIQQDLIVAFRDDFAKYARRLPHNLLDATLLAVAASLGRKFVYAKVAEGVKSHQAKQSLELLTKARVCHLVQYTTAAGLPLGGETKDTFQKAILLDVGLLQALLGTPAAVAFPGTDSLSPQVRDQIAQQLVGQQIRYSLANGGGLPELYYWQREGGRPGEIDYLIQAAGRILPIEVKAGAAGAMKSLHQFMFDKRFDIAVRIDANAPTQQDMSVTTTQGDRVAYLLHNLPHYLSWRIPELPLTRA